MMSSVKHGGHARVGAVRVAAAGAFLSAAMLGSGARAFPPLPGAGDPAGATAAPPAAGPALLEGLDPQKVYEHVRRGVVAVERGGVPLALGTVLGGDGRVLTSLSALGGIDTAEVRYADGTAVHARVGGSDTALDLALLVPQSKKWTEGLNASEVDPAGAELRAMLPAPGRGARIGPVVAGVRGQADTHSRDGQPLLNLLDLDLKGPAVAGAPLLDATGNVVAVLVRACKGSGAAPEPPGPAAACVPVVVGAPVATVRSFLSRAPAAPSPAGPWLGIRGEPEASGSVRGVRVTAVAPSSPAEKAGLKASSDVIVAVDGRPIDTPEKLAEAIGRHAPGDSVKLLVFGGDRFREPSVALRTAP
jgi:serine protease Do